MTKQDEPPWKTATDCGYDIIKGHTRRMIKPECEGETHGRFLPEPQARAGWEGARIVVFEWAFLLETTFKKLDITHPNYNQAKRMYQALQNLKQFLGVK